MSEVRLSQAMVNFYRLLGSFISCFIFHIVKLWRTVSCGHQMNDGVISIVSQVGYRPVSVLVDQVLETSPSHIGGRVHKPSVTEDHCWLFSRFGYAQNRVFQCYLRLHQLQLKLITLTSTHFQILNQTPRIHQKSSCLRYSIQLKPLFLNNRLNLSNGSCFSRTRASSQTYPINGILLNGLRVKPYSVTHFS